MKKSILNGIRVGIVAMCAISASFTLTSCENEQMQVQPVEQQMSLSDRLNRDVAFHNTVSAYRQVADPTTARANTMGAAERKSYVQELEALGNSGDLAQNAAKRGFASVEAFVTVAQKFTQVEKVLLQKYPELANMSSLDRARIYAGNKTNAGGRMQDWGVCVCTSSWCICIVVETLE